MCQLTSKRVCVLRVCLYVGVLSGIPVYMFLFRARALLQAHRHRFEWNKDCTRRYRRTSLPLSLAGLFCCVLVLGFPFSASCLVELVKAASGNAKVTSSVFAVYPTGQDRLSQYLYEIRVRRTKLSILRTGGNSTRAGDTVIRGWRGLSIHAIVSRYLYMCRSKSRQMPVYLACRMKRSHLRTGSTSVFSAGGDSRLSGAGILLSVFCSRGL